jgi:hypothetical protein
MPLRGKAKKAEDIIAGAGPEGRSSVPLRTLEVLMGKT